ncbi:hypothetical protein FOMPIDRAFT_1045077 [Fomitopsis schrenkii]|uniref:Uncharacterized protein n=1 Tax=Fomitopsis schrenkii TaxID=2126942 RepID=S8FXD8_FOMSC|nr:hypothetical protein FOMPIDRAFT_1045077 [Fomitopsis schrenkii]
MFAVHLSRALAAQNSLLTGHLVRQTIIRHCLLDRNTERKDRGPCVSRFGPERPPSSAAAAPSDGTPRVWMTREESERMLSTSKETKQPELTHKLPERPVRTESESRRPNDVPNASTGFNGSASRNDRQPVYELVRPAKTTPGPQRAMNGPHDVPGGRQSPVDVRPRGPPPSLEGATYLLV